MRIPFATAIAMMALTARVAAAQAGSDPSCTDKAAPTPQVVFEHAKTNADRHYTVSLRPGEPLVVCIAQTALEGFTYTIAGVTKAPAPGEVVAMAAGEPAALGTRRLVKLHEDQYGGYIVAISRSTPGAIVGELDGKSVELKDVMLVVSVRNEQFQYEFAGAFSISSLTDPQYATSKSTVDGKDVFSVIRDHDAEDERRLGLGAFIHVFHDKVPWVAATFGLGVASDNKVTYFVGPSVRLGKALAVTVGPVWGAITRLPTGVSEGSVVADASALKDLPTRTGRGWFVGFSYTFLQARQAVEKPFAPPAK